VWLFRVAVNECADVGRREQEAAARASVPARTEAAQVLDIDRDTVAARKLAALDRLRRGLPAAAVGGVPAALTAAAGIAAGGAADRTGRGGVEGRATHPGATRLAATNRPTPRLRSE
jgi:hypothetical protein